MAKVLIAGLFTYPFGGPAANYIRLLAKGMVEAGAQVHVLALDPIDTPPQTAGAGTLFTHDGVTYESAARSPFGSSENGLQRFIRMPGIISRSRRRFDELLREQDVDAILLYVRSYTKASPLVAVARRHKVPVFMHLVEWPTAEVFQAGRANPLFWDHRAGTLSLVTRCSGAVVITAFLEEKLKDSGRPVLRVPSVASFSQSEETPGAPLYVPSQPPDPFMLCFSGGMKGTDDVFTMLDAFRTALKRGSNVALKILGTNCKSGKARRFRERVEADESVRGHVHFVGRVSDARYMDELRQTDATLFPRTLDPRALGAFPMRIPECLALGKPLITTAVPDVPEYLVDGEHACIARPGDAEDLADRICKLASDRTEAVRIARNGFEQGQRCFDYRRQSERILAFLTGPANAAQ